MQNFKEVPVGTKCFVKTRHGWYITYVKRFTKTLVITERKDGTEGRWSIINGTLTGQGKWEHTSLEVFKDSHQKIVNDTLLSRKINKVLDALVSHKKSMDQEDLTSLENILTKFL